MKKHRFQKPFPQRVRATLSKTETLNQSVNNLPEIAWIDQWSNKRLHSAGL